MPGALVADFLLWLLKLETWCFCFCCWSPGIIPSPDDCCATVALCWIVGLDPCQLEARSLSIAVSSTGAMSSAAGACGSMGGTRNRAWTAGDGTAGPSVGIKGTHAGRGINDSGVTPGSATTEAVGRGAASKSGFFESDVRPGDPDRTYSDGALSASAGREMGVQASGHAPSNSSLCWGAAEARSGAGT